MSLSVADRLIGLVEQLDIPYLYERSFKVSQQSLLTHRFLITLHKKLLQPNTWPILSSIANAMNMPQIYAEPIQEKLSNADFIHFGFEQQANGCFCKIYLEFPRQFKLALETVCTHKEPMLLHLAYKWDVSNNGNHAIATYHFQPELTLEAMMRRFTTVTKLPQNSIVASLGEELLKLANKQIAEEEIFFLDVVEQDNARRSFDINVYDANLTMNHIGKLLESTLLNFNIPNKQWQQFLDPIKPLHVGHLSGGIGRDGQQFFSVFFGVEKREK